MSNQNRRRQYSKAPRKALRLCLHETIASNDDNDYDDNSYSDRNLRSGNGDDCVDFYDYDQYETKEYLMDICKIGNWLDLVMLMSRLVNAD